METRRWLNPSLPQTMQIAVFLCYFRAVLSLVYGLPGEMLALPLSTRSGGSFSNPLLYFGLPVALGFGGWLIANERKLGWKLAVVAASLPLLGRLLLAVGLSLGVSIPGPISPFSYEPIDLIFEVALFMLLVHPQSREYQRIWFK